MLGRIELGIDHVAGNVDVDRSAAERWGAANPSKAVSTIKTRVGALELSVIEVIQRAMMKRKQTAIAVAPPWGSIERNAGCMLNRALAVHPQCSPYGAQV